MNNNHASDHNDSGHHDCSCCRRDFLQTAGATVGALAFLSAGSVVAGADDKPTPRAKKKPNLLGAFMYIPTEQLKKEGYWSWPGSNFDPEGRQREYSATLAQAASKLDANIALESKPLADDALVSRFIERVKQEQPDALVLFFFKKLMYGQMQRILDAVKIPVILCIPLGTPHITIIKKWQAQNGVHLVGDARNLEAVQDCVRMIRAARWMKDARLINILGAKRQAAVVPHLGTQVWTIPHSQFVETYQNVHLSPEVERLAQTYRSKAREIVEPGINDINDAARCYFALKRILKDEQGDSLMMDCLPGLSKPHKHVPPCMGFMSLHDEGIAAGCQADLDASLTMMLGSRLIGATGFMHNPSWSLDENLYFGAHCTCPSKMAGPESESLPYILRSHNEAGWGCVPQVLFPPDQTATIALYRVKEEPRMAVYKGRLIRCYPKLSGGCRTNFIMRIDGVDNADKMVYDGHHVLFFGDHEERLKTFCKLHRIKLIGA
ncbi:MAG: hypothetical protein JW959_04495 [Pirellulales bacterium]|nr:hypothetical protein [Pirellulales bacterium]